MIARRPRYKTFRAQSRAYSHPHAVQFLTVNTKTANAGTSVSLDQCFLLGFAAESAFECGDLRVVHALPSTRVRGVVRTPTLLNNSQHAHPFPIVRANVAMPSGTVTSATATLQLNVNSVLTTVATQNYTGAQLPGDSTRRIALAFNGNALSTGVYPYTLTVAVTVAGNPSAVTVKSTDTLVIVNRSASEFGAGWWLAGYERVIELLTSELLWIGGDGSTRLYTHRNDGGSLSLTKWMTDSITRPDSIVRPPFTYTFTRYVPNGGRIVFDNSGQHTVTIDRLGDSTRFSRDGNGFLAMITLPPLSSPYAFVYNSNQKLDRVVAPPFYLGAPDRATIATVVNGQTTVLTNPDGSTTSFAYAAR